MTRPEFDRAALLNAVLRNDLSAFIERTFAEIDPGSTYLHNWHIDAIAHHLALVEAGIINRLIITMPPRSLKSISASVAFPAWLLGRDPRKRILAVSYSEALAEKLALDCMKVLQSHWYQDCFPAARISPKRGARTDFETTRGGGRYSSSVGGSITGRGGDVIILDDPHKPDEVGSDTKRTAVLDWYKSTLLSRLNDPQSGPIVLIQQRVHEEDLAGMLLEQGGWVQLNLPAIAEETEAVDLGQRGDVIRQEGDVLHAARLPRDLLDQRRTELGSYVFNAQYQQRPAPPEGGIVRWEWFGRYNGDGLPAQGGLVVQSWDTASKADELNDYSVCTTWLVLGKDVYLLDVYRARLEYPDLRKMIVELAGRWQSTQVVIEDAGSGISLAQDLENEGALEIARIKPINDKSTRLLRVTPIIEEGRVHLPQDAAWLTEFRRELMLFPNGKHDDQVDSFSQFLGWHMRPRDEIIVGSYGFGPGF